MLFSRSTDKLLALKNEILSKYKDVDVIVCPFDFTTTSSDEWGRLEGVVKALGNVTVLVNNVALNHDIPVSFLEESSKRVNDIIKVYSLKKQKKSLGEYFVNNGYDKNRPTKNDFPKKWINLKHWFCCWYGSISLPFRLCCF